MSSAFKFDLDEEVIHTNTPTDKRTHQKILKQNALCAHASGWIDEFPAAIFKINYCS